MRTYAFIDAANLFYGGQKSLGWKIDYQKLFAYLQSKYGASETFYFGGVEIYDFPYDYLRHTTVPLAELEQYVVEYMRRERRGLNEADLLLLSRHLSRVRFYERLKYFGYNLILKPVKLYHQEDGSTKRKANCDVDMAFHLMKQKDDFDHAVILSGDGDFLPVLKHLRDEGKKVTILARGLRTAKEIRKFAAADFRDFVTLKRSLALDEPNKKSGHAKYPLHV